MTHDTNIGEWDDRDGWEDLQFIVEVEDFDDDGWGTVQASVYDHYGNPNDSATVIFFNGDTGHVYGVDENGQALAELPPGPWSAYAYDSDETTWLDLWDGGVVHVEAGSEYFVEFFLYPMEEYGYLIGQVYTMIDDSTAEGLDAYVIVEDNEGNMHFEGHTNVWGDIGDPLPPGEYLVQVETEYGYQEQYVSMAAGSFSVVSFEFQTDDEEDIFEFLGEFEGHFYFLSPMEATWHDAHMFTDTAEVDEGIQIYLGTITSPGENEFIWDSIDSLDASSVWIGFTDEEEEGNWQWVTGEEVTYTNWAGGEPNDAGGAEDWAHFWNDGTWNDHTQYVEFRFVVEVDGLESYAQPNILSITDIPDDQGGQVYITFERSIFDTDSIDNRDPELYTVERLDGDTWVGLGSIGAYASDVYTVEATTLADSTSENDAVMTYRIIANMEEGNYDSDPASGYSVDNIAPGLIAGLQANVSDGVVNLSWNISEASDLSHYVVYRGNSPDFTADEETMLGETTDPGYSDDVTELGDYYYVVTAVDIHENESDPSEAVNVTLLSLVDVHGLPEEYALHQNYPNPFNPTTTLRYDLPEDATVSVVIYDMMGRQVRTLVSGQASAGYHSTLWNATNNRGQSVSAGLYLYTIHAGDFRQTKKMVLLK